ncbi:Poly(R)-hydroxyalkanoic acid synthase subunit (PHA_synth_III_E) [Methylobacterium phyllostachyos]|uniref:Poly(3-hydroxyalkanoate) polymerase subunit PhaE n=1 Tax=Methylobacterium phyllostachyos TaxID=582672 RepID=A0A1H0IGD5_9HYPH|nr:poly(R)-hydroxyalkanoic acid synthase subunit PhaE [Methylobacterium phyllostachyos]SDO30425.1 Poly(R)-hydroxyalkanoic acid synthase subunit (PHA_synth_III_E) [Methylobacterium phyllostachyos]
MDQFDAFRAMGEFWTRAAAGFLAPGFGRTTPALSWSEFPSADLAGLATAQAKLTEAWTAATALSQALTKSLQGGPDAPDPTAGAVLARIFDPQAWLGGSAEFDAALTRMSEGPQLADLWQTERRYAALFTAWAALRRAQSEHQAVMLDAWTRAAGTFAQEANALAERGESFASARAMMGRWIETANAVLLDVQRSETFLTSQRAVLRASTDLRLAQQDVAAFLSEFYGQPTRAELDDVHKSLTELRREVRALRRERRQAGKAAKAGGSQVGEDAHG